ncbi:hypothetical protein [Jiangella rhizosphaerae]|uniref:DUF3108 domain-containing protein n=1 Tax=Jiangella rhizosphaerae TaxID=2293569 RepID=A0A418KTL8_9ACTN|nr:hypothetical protein [Jiangella rhizosphaerae]RIQ28612.1 hypothetical protein DY240_08855 [Jiangella rhizosphaerae]
MSRIRGALGALGAVAAVTSAVLTAGPAAAGEPTRVDDDVTVAYLEAADGDRGLDISLARSATAGTEALARLWGGPEGDHLAEGSGTSEWTDSTFQATIELFDDDGAPAGTVTVAGSYTPAGEPRRDVQRFNDGNVRVHMDHTTTALALEAVTVALDGVPWELRFADGHHELGHLFVADPATYVGREEFVAFGEPKAENATDFFLDGTLKDLGVTFAYADAPIHAAGGIDVADGSWEGTLRMMDESGEVVGEAPATATLTPLGRTTRLFDQVRGGFERWTATPYLMTLTVAGPVAPVRVTVEVTDVRHALHTSPLGG